MEQSVFTRRQILKAAGAAGGLATMGAILGPRLILADDEPDDAALGNFGPWSEPRQIVELAADPNRGDFDFHPAISRDQLTLYFTTTRYAPIPPLGKFPLPPSAIAVVHRPERDAPWDTSTLANVTPLNAQGKATGVPNLASSDHVMYFQSSRPDPRVASGHGHLWVSHRRHRDDDLGPFGWETPEPVPGLLNTQAPSQLNQSAATYFRGRMYYAQFQGIGSFADPNQDFDIYVSQQMDDGSFGPGTRVEALEPDEPGEPELTEVFLKPWSRQTRTAISRDGLEMFITSNRSGGLFYTNSPTPIENLWVATRTDASSELWNPPTLVPQVNSGLGEGGPALSWDGKTLYFFSARPTTTAQPQKPQNWQLWMSTREKLEG
jgi:hypothetical protein